MLKALPIVVAIIFCFSNFGGHSGEKNLAKDTNVQAAAYEFGEINEEIIPRNEKILRIVWEIVPGAVKYEVLIENETFYTYTNGIEVAVNDFDANFQINALTFDGTPIEENLTIIEVENVPNSIKTTTEFNKMNYSPLYPVYSWIPTLGANYYAIELIRDGKIIRRYFTRTQNEDVDFDFYDKEPVIDEGEYFWRIRALNQDDKPITRWTEKNPSNTFIVKHKIRFCALGDSITHGGGAISVPPSTTIYNWETYCAIPIKNLGRSGDTTAEILDRFENDVLPFKPEVIFIMAGVNDYRANIFGQESVENLSALEYKCIQNGIRPIFITPTPLNPAQIQKVNLIEQPSENWQENQRIICDWIRSRSDFIDVNEKLTDENGNLIENLSVDGLHPDADGKRLIGEAVGAWLDKYLNLN